MISTLGLLIPITNNEIECVVAIDANKDVIVGVLLQDDASKSLRSEASGILTGC
jgi:hypothetical protein